MTSACLCEKERKVPPEKQEFLSDQRTTRLMRISTVDKCATKQLTKRQKRRADEVYRTEKYRKLSASDESVFVDPSSDDNEIVEDALDKQCDTVITEVMPLIQKSLVRAPKRDMPALARACDRHMVSDRSAAAIASAVLQDFGLITADNSLNVIDPRKVRRERIKKRKQLQGIDNNLDLCGIYFDGRKDKTIVNIQESSLAKTAYAI